MEMLNILLIDEQPVVREGLESFLMGYADLDIVAYANNAQDGLKQVRNRPLDVVLMDLALPDMSGREAIRLIHGENPKVAIIVYSNRSDEVFVYQSLKAGARGYLLKSTPLKEVVNALRRIHMDEYILSRELSPTIINFYLEHRDLGEDCLGDYQELSDREKQVFRLIAHGGITREVADVLCISPKTVAKHRTSIKKKLSLNSSVEMTQYAMRIGILSQEDFAKEPKRNILHKVHRD
ncbi:MAG: response regulator [Desulfuromonadales bacterium]